MEVLRTTAPTGYIIVASNGAPEAHDLSDFAGRYIKVVCWTDNVFYNTAPLDPDGTVPDTPADYLKRTSETSGSSETGVADTVEKGYRGEEFVLDGKNPVLVVEPAAGSGVVILVKVKSPYLSHMPG